MNDLNAKKISKFLSLILRHKPETVGLSLDKNGWAGTQELLDRINNKGFSLSFEELQWIVENNEKRRFSLSSDFSRIRANQGHSLQVDLNLPQKEPPEILFHGTAEKNLESIKKYGINKGSRHHVHLSPDIPTAEKVGMRHGKPVVLQVKAGKMNVKGIVFFESENGVWLTENVSPEFIVFPYSESTGP